MPLHKYVQEEGVLLHKSEAVVLMLKLAITGCLDTCLDSFIVRAPIVIDDRGLDRQVRA